MYLKEILNLKTDSNLSTLTQRYWRAKQNAANTQHQDTKCLPKRFCQCHFFMATVLFLIIQLCCWYAHYQSSYGDSSCLNPHDSPYPSVSMWLSILLAWIKNLLAPLGTCKHGAKPTHGNWRANSCEAIQGQISHFVH